jgi:hypothetical protein
MTTRLSIWEKAVARRRAAIRQAMRKMAKTRTKSAKLRIIRDLNNMMYYGIMNKHQQHWHKINGIWRKNTIRTRSRHASAL